MPLPLAMMIPFMGIQSAVMMKQAGENWQYGKRLQSAMSNEDFNKQTMESIFEKNTKSVSAMIPTMKQSIQEMRGFQDFIIVEIIELMRRGLETGLGAIFGMTAQESNQFFGGTTGPALISDTVPEGTETPTGISLTIEQVQAMSTNTLLFETQPSQISKYTEATQAHMLTEKLSRASDTTITEAGETSILELKNIIWKAEAVYLVWLTTTTFETWRDGIFSTHPMRQPLINFGLTFTQKKSKSTASDQQLNGFRAMLKQDRVHLLAQLDQGKTGSTLDSFHWNINRDHTLIWAHQLIFSR